MRIWGRASRELGSPRDRPTRSPCPRCQPLCLGSWRWPWDGREACVGVLCGGRTPPDPCRCVCGTQHPHSASPQTCPQVSHLGLCESGQRLTLSDATLCEAEPGPGASAERPRVRTRLPVTHGCACLRFPSSQQELVEPSVGREGPVSSIYPSGQNTARMWSSWALGSHITG